MKRLIAVIFILLGSISAHAQSGKSTIVNDINTDFADNTAGAITAALLRTITTTIVSSYLDYTSCGVPGGMIYYASATSPTCIGPGGAGQVLRTYATSPAWQSLATMFTGGNGIDISGTITPTIQITSMTGPITVTGNISASGFIQGKLETDTTFASAAISTTGRLIIYDSHGTAYKIPACLSASC